MLLKKVIFVRVDKIGDLVCTLPMDEICWQLKIDCKWIISDGLQFLPDNAVPKREYFLVSLKKKWRSFLRLIDFLKKENPDLVLIYYAPWWVSFSCWWVGISDRVGRRSQWHSFLFLNRTLRQSRSQSEKHEADYNWELTHFAFKKKINSTKINNTTPLLILKPPELRHLLEKFQLQSNHYVVVHVGMAGSALNWTEDNYDKLIEVLVLKTVVVLTGTADDEVWMRPLRKKWLHHPQIRWAQSCFSLQELLYILKNAFGVVAPSTGVLQLAAAVGTRSVGLYSPILSHHPRRWGVRGSRSVILLPEIQCSEKNECLGAKCSQYYCMSSLAPEKVIQSLFNE